MSKRNPGRLPLLLAIAFSLVGLTASAVLLQHHVAIVKGSDPLLGGLCEVIAAASCDEVLSSEWGKIKGIPTAFLGFVYFASVMSWLIVVGRPTGRFRRLNLVPILAAAVGTLACAGFAYIMYFKLPRFCPLCTTTHSAALALLITTLIMWPRRQQQPAYETVRPDVTGPDSEPTPAGQTLGMVRPIIGTMIMAVALSATAWLGFDREIKIARSHEFERRWREYDEDYQAKYRQFIAQPVVDLPLEEDEPIRGKPDAPHTVVVFSDVLCPFCRGYEEYVKQQVKKYPDDLRVVFRHFPMNKKCNPQLKSDLHIGACEGAWTTEAARVLAGPDAFWGMLDELFANQKEFRSNPKGAVDAAATRLGLNLPALWANFQGPHSDTLVRARVNRHVELGQKLGITGTPMAYFDGRPLKIWSGDANFWRYLIKEAKNLPPPPATQPESKTASSLPGE